MGDIILALATLAMFTFGHYVVERFAKFMSENYRGWQKTRTPRKNTYIIKAEGKTAEKSLNERKVRF